ncbi:cobalt-precorrin-6A reductase [Nocardia mangyaensis]|uniref:cobalt-precorrin-6A reductase n=1 Tax=Nocardia mangyaensis TaxID=2213200 RepID=UPI0026748685|nr:cobalt-precorrin-6A reductase [Nocardia mangyaensis]MDO3649463.1 cobalt-precorrin-6A reductase [Nocardia mangyaensis]
MRVLILGGTGEARELARIASGERGLDIVSSLAGRVANPRLPVGAVRVGGFGGVEGLRTYLRENAVDAVVDATHPFAAQVSTHAATATRELGIPALHLRRPEWVQRRGDLWTRVPDLTAAVAALPGHDEPVLLTIGRQGVGAFAGCVRHRFVIRSIDAPSAPLPPRYKLLLARGPFTFDEELVLMSRHRIGVLVTKNSGGEQTEAKIFAARTAGLPVIMVDRPPLPAGARAVDAVPAAVEWLRQVASEHVR